MDDNKALAELIFPNITKTIEDLEKEYPARNLPEGAMVTRFAPSPTGFLHSGSLYTTLLNWRLAKQSGGVFYIRLEDTDQKREVEGSGKELLDQLKNFGIEPDEGYLGDHESGNYGPYVQSKRSEIYDVVIKHLIEIGRAYPCFCTAEDVEDTRRKQERNKFRPGYYGRFATCRKVSIEEAIEKIKNGEPYVLRFKSMGNEENKISISDEIKGKLELTENDLDIVIRKSDGLPTYHLAHACDDHFMHTTHVIRGEEWLPSLPIHVELFNTLGFQLPKYAHVASVNKIDQENGTKRKLSKRKDKEAAVSYFLEQGYPKSGFLEYLLTLINSNYEAWRDVNPDADKYDFTVTFEKMGVDGPLFDVLKIDNICKDRLSRLNKNQISELALNWAKEYDNEFENLINRDYEYFTKIMNIEREIEKPRKDYTRFSDIKNSIMFFYDDLYETMLANTPVLPFNENISKEDTILVLKTFLEKNKMDEGESEWFNNLKDIGISLGFASNNKEYKANKEAFKGHIGDVAQILRIALTTKTQTPNLFNILEILGKEKYESRINNIINILSK